MKLAIAGNFAWVFGKSVAWPAMMMADYLAGESRILSETRCNTPLGLSLRCAIPDAGEVDSRANHEQPWGAVLKPLVDFFQVRQGPCLCHGQLDNYIGNHGELFFKQQQHWYLEVVWTKEQQKEIKASKRPKEVFNVMSLKLKESEESHSPEPWCSCGRWCWSLRVSLVDMDWSLVEI